MSTDTLNALRRSRGPTTEAPARGRRIPAWLLPLALLLGFALLFAILFRDRLLPAREVEVAPVLAIQKGGPPGETAADPSPGPRSQAAAGAMRFQASGWIEPDPYPIKATALVDGVVDEVHVLEGQRVAKGDLVATLIAEDFELRLAAAESEQARRQSAREAHCAGITRTIEQLKGQQAQQTAAEAIRDSSRERLERVRNAGRGVPEIEIIEARENLRRVEALVLAAEAKVMETAARLNEMAFETVSMEENIAAAGIAADEARLALERTRIRAPIDGRIMRLLAAPGQKRMLGMDDPDSSTVAILYDPGRLQVRAEVQLADAGGLAVGQPARIRTKFLPDHEFHGTVTRIVGEADTNAVTLQAKVAIHDPVDVLRPEMLCSVEFLAPARGEGASMPGSDGGPLALWVPAGAIENGRVWVVDPDRHRVSPRQVETLGPEQDGRLPVGGDLRPGERVVLSPGQLQPDQRVDPKPLTP